MLNFHGAKQSNQEVKLCLVLGPVFGMASSKGLDKGGKEAIS
jgi:hypothetical protein